MKALLGMAKQRRKDESKQFKPMSKLNLPKNQQIQPQQYQQEFEEQYQPEEQQILGYAQYIGIKLPEQEDLLYIAREGLMANLPPDWDEQQAQDGNILYFNRRTGQMIPQHPCDQYYRQLVIKQRKKRGSSQNKFGGIQPVGNIGSTFSQQPMKGLPIQPPKKDMDPLVKMQMEKKKKKLQQQKRKEFEDKKNKIKQKYQKKRQALQSQYKAKQKKTKQKIEEELQSERQRMKKKMSEEQRNQQQKSKKQIQRFERQLRLKLDKKYFDKRLNEKERIEKKLKQKRQQIRQTLQNELKSKKKQMQDEYRQKMKILGQKQRQAVGQKSDADILSQEVAALKEQIIKRRITQFSQKIDQQKQIQQVQFKAKLLQLQKSHQQSIKNFETSAPKNQVKFDTLAQEVQLAQKQELQALEYQLQKLKQLKKLQKQQALQNYKKKFLQEKKDDIQRLQRQNENLLSKFRRMKQEQYENKLSEAEKKIKQSYLNSLKQVKQKYDQEQQIIQLQGQTTRKNDTIEKQSLDMMNQVVEKLGWKQQALRGQIQSMRQQISKLSKKSKPVRHRLNDEQLRMYELIRQKLQEDNLINAH